MKKRTGVESQAPSSPGYGQVSASPDLVRAWPNGSVESAIMEEDHPRRRWCALRASSSPMGRNFIPRDDKPVNDQQRY